MPPMLQFGSGSNACVDGSPSAFRYPDNTSNLVEPTQENQSDQVLQKRDTIDWLVASIPQKGTSPLAPAGYQVWSNVKDFGAKAR
ncbi:hypothetical protein ColLi_06444 [Colletotrichum liriopes]|uniref:Uncharacterized protein n=1 Tax=Colletotrichum liriopes TaxID=708192 RepID=A0AA37LTG4_9PEZI|nr:hypothetical protein ColLi_06444 [Colletotrichum liriopes]